MKLVRPRNDALTGRRTQHRARQACLRRLDGPNLRDWKDQLLAQSIQPIQQFAYTTVCRLR
jgi:hypothetical protein